MKTPLPWWLIVIIVLETLPMFLGPVAALTEPKIMGGPDATTINQAAYLYAARNLSVGIAFLIAFALRSAPMLFILIIVRLLTDLMDLPNILYHGLASKPPLMIFIFVAFYYIPVPFALRYLWKQMKLAGQ